MPLLSEIIAAIPGNHGVSAASKNVEISSITCDSRFVQKGSIFVALKGEKMDGNKFIADAIKNGAAAVFSESHENGAIKVENARAALAHMAAAFYRKQPAHMVAVTGTDGKTSTADFYRQFWNLLGKKSASIGTLGILSGSGEMLYPGTHTTPDSVQLHKILSEITADYVAMEASSHGIDQRRLDGVKLEAAAFTNITRDHLDYHKTEEAYFAAKARLFDALLPAGKIAVINADDRRFAALSEICKSRGHEIIGFGRNGREFKIDALELLPHGQNVKFSLLGKTYVIDVPLVGAFQTMNILAALGLVYGSGGNLEKAVSIIPRLAGVPGRLEQVAKLSCGATVFIDYAHTPMALANILNTLRPHTQNKLHVVFGCGGDRDPGKRPEMGKIASELADEVIITDDNPRSESAAKIRAAIKAASPSAKEVADRKEAIYVALQGLRAGDVLVIAGKGHEKTQIVGDKTYPFNDAEVARAGVKELNLAA